MIYNLENCPSGLSGIYKINFSNGKCYIGQSNDIKRRIKEHNRCRSGCYPIR
jgi:predicted GIY-YIG superfamily endonuclease